MKNQESEGPIPLEWRSVFIDIVNSLVCGEYQSLNRINAVRPVSDGIKDQIRNYIEAYGEQLIPLPEETWQSSVCIYMGEHWDVLIDLWTMSEGRSDMVLSAKVFENDSEYEVDIGMVYVP
ncbi:DUF7668 domain-containing protein [Pleionea litopenaei]|uniref:DUF7668 domain-containing protein n=1 Tax=Pleionea litopenaei TaxID=3070815 RepID=A0AA51RW92_9GAMM|nr:hypothetical protein [Pleionea sp. HL-JVS1]WMS88816.1 hypothetical protein Q9312_07830 [Pleionea sp. HL-JVS1]